MNESQYHLSPAASRAIGRCGRWRVALALLVGLTLSLPACGRPASAPRVTAIPSLVTTERLAQPGASPQPNATEAMPTSVAPPETTSVQPAVVRVTRTNTTAPSLTPVTGTPSIDAFEVGPAQIRFGEPITLSWRVTAERALIHKLDHKGRLLEPPYTVPLAGMLVITDYQRQGDRASFLLTACIGELCDNALGSIGLIPVPTPSQPAAAAEILSFSASPSPADPAASVTLGWQVRGASRVTVQWSDRTMENVVRAGLPLSGSLSVPVSEVNFTDGDKIQFGLSALDADGQLLHDQEGHALARHISLPLRTEMRILAVGASPDPVQRGGIVTLRWDVPNAVSVGITRLSPEGIFLPSEAVNLPASGAIELQVPEDYTTAVTYHLGARDANGVLVSRTLAVDIICPYKTFDAPTCPLTSDAVSAAYQPFERGHMLWRADTRQILALYDAGNYEIYADTWDEGEPIPNVGTPPPGAEAPLRGFGKLWANNPEVRDRLGWPLAAETGYTALIETARSSIGRYPATDTYFRLPDDRVARLSGRSEDWTILK
jgi:hypothetical protein